MLRKNKATLSYLFERFDKGSATVFLLSSAAVLIIGTSHFNGTISRESAGYLLGIFATFALVSFFRPVISMAADGYEALVQVVLATWLLIACAIASWCFCYYCVTGQLGSSSGTGLKLLDVPTLLVAIGAASTGWYVHFQLTRRSHRTSHAVSLVLGSRTNGEFQKNNERVRRYLPDKDAVNAVDQKFFSQKALKIAYQAFTASKNPKNISNLRSAKAIESLKYMLNYYEFMAVGVRLGDIEERILYETIGTHVCHLYDRSEKLRKWMSSPEGGKQTLVFEYLDELVASWRNNVADDEAERRKSINGVRH